MNLTEGKKYKLYGGLGQGSTVMEMGGSGREVEKK